MVPEREDQLASLIHGLFAMRLVTVRVSSVSPTQIWSLWSHHRPEFWRSILPLEKKLSSSDYHDSRGIHDVHLGVHCYLQDGGRSRLEIKVEFHKGAVPLSALLAFYWHYCAYSLSSVRCLSSFLLCSFFLRWNGGRLDGKYMLEVILRKWRFENPTVPASTCTKENSLTLCPVLAVIGFVASEGKFNPTLPIRVVLISVYQWSSHCGLGSCGIGASSYPLFFWFFLPFVGLQVSSFWSDFSIPSHVRWIFISFLTFLADLFHGSWSSALSRIQWMFADIRQPRYCFYMGDTDDLGRL